MKKIAILVILPFTIAFLLQKGFHAENMPQAIHAAPAFFGEVAWFAGLIGVAFLVFEEQLKSVVLPELRNLILNEIMPGMLTEWVNTRTKVTEILEKKEFVIGREFLERETKTKNQDLIREMTVESNDSEDLNRAQTALSEGNTGVAIAILSKLAESDQKYNTQLLSVLVLSKDPEDWRRAETILTKFGGPEHYIRLSFAYWTNKEFDKAISLLETGHTLAQEGKTPKDREFIEKARNNLAYFYADAMRHDKADIAIKMTEEALALAKQKDGENSMEHVKTLDTLGYVKISLGQRKEIIEEGIEYCENARRLGAPLDFYVKHLSRALDRLRFLQANEP